jgi:hypothetical protein
VAGALKFQETGLIFFVLNPFPGPNHSYFILVRTGIGTKKEIEKGACDRLTSFAVYGKRVCMIKFALHINFKKGSTIQESFRKAT